MLSLTKRFNARKRWKSVGARENVEGLNIKVVAAYAVSHWTHKAEHCHECIKCDRNWPAVASRVQCRIASSNIQSLL